jgi:hypothetical protein
MLFGGDKIWDKTRDRHGKEMNGFSLDRHIMKQELGEDDLKSEGSRHGYFVFVQGLYMS